MFGEYHQCLEIAVTKNGKTDIRGQYCLVKFRLQLPSVKRIPSMKLRTEPLMKAPGNASDFIKVFAPIGTLLYYAENASLGLCVPSGCNRRDVSQVVKYVFGKIHMEAETEFCETKDDINYWTTRRIIIMCVFAFFGLLVLIGTIVDYMWKKENAMHLVTRLLMCFSLTNNFPKLIGTNTSEKNLTSFHGIRSIGTFWVILGHEYLSVATAGAASHMANYESYVSSFFEQIILNGFLSVELFFFMGGFLNSYMRTKTKESRKSQPSIAMTIIHRLWRIYPSMIVCQLLYFFLSSGPFGRIPHMKMTENCERYWWKNFLFINTYFHPRDACMLHTWFLSADMQLFLVSLLTVPVLLRSLKLGAALHVCLILLASCSSVLWWWIEGFPPTFEVHRINLRELYDFLQAFINPLVHCGSYFIGILLGHVIAIKQEMKISKKIQVIGWLISSFLCLFVLFISKRWNSGVEYSKLESSLYAGFSKTLFGLGIGWMVFCCATGNGGVVHYILSLKIWFPMAKISYMVYLISPIVQASYHSNLSSSFDFTHMNLVWIYLGNVVISVLVSLALVLMVESPLVRMEKELFGSRKVGKKASPDTQHGITQNIETNIDNELKLNGL